LIVAIDASVLVFLLDEAASAPKDPSTGEPVTRCKERIEFLLESLQKQRSKLVIPAPVLAEVLVQGRSAAAEWLNILNGHSVIKVADFDQLAAVEFAERFRLSRSKMSAGAEKRKMKFDDQILAIAHVQQATVLYSDDKGFKAHETTSFKVIGIAELPLPPNKQAEFEFSSVE
jgi:predicted nucleic acid-binding protein